MIKLAPNTCPGCYMGTENPSELSSQFDCTKCEYSYSVKWQLNRHIRECHNKRFECDICHKIFGQKWNLKVHSKMHIYGEILHCNLCTESFPTKYDHEMHIITEHKMNGRWVCHECLNNGRRPGSFKQRYQLETHLNNKHVQQKIKCAIPGCEFSAYHRYYVNRHCYEKHNIKKPNGQVNDKARGNNMLAGNMDNQHALEEKIYYCNCTRTFENRTKFIQHLRDVEHLPYYSPPNTVSLEAQIPTYPRSLSPEEAMVPNEAQYTQHVEGVEYLPYYSPPNTVSLDEQSYPRSLSAQETMVPKTMIAEFENGAVYKEGVEFLPYYSPPNTVSLDAQMPTYPRSLSSEESMVPNGEEYTQHIEGVEYWPGYSPNTASLHVQTLSHSRSLSAEEIMAPEITTAGYGTINGQKIPSRMEEPQRQPLDLSMSRFKRDNKLK